MTVTNNPADWEEVDLSILDGGPPLWQHHEHDNLFSEDGGKTFYDLDGPVEIDGTPFTYTSKEHTNA